MDSGTHWNRVYRTSAADEVSWYQGTPALSLELIEAAGLDRQSSIIDVGGGVATLLDELLGRQPIERRGGGAPAPPKRVKI